MFLVYEALMRRAKVQSPENPVARENRAHQKERQKPTSRAPEETRSTVLAAHHQHPNPIRNPFPNGLKNPLPCSASNSFRNPSNGDAQGEISAVKATVSTRPA